MYVHKPIPDHPTKGRASQPLAVYGQCMQFKSVILTVNWLFVYYSCCQLCCSFKTTNLIIDDEDGERFVEVQDEEVW